MRITLQQVSRWPLWQWKDVVIHGLWIAAAAPLALWGAWTHRGILLCPFKRLTGVNCPGCGSTRATLSLLHGDPQAAFGLNPLAMLTLCLLAAVVLLRITGGRRLSFELSRPQRRLALGALICLLGMNWVYVLLRVG